MAAVSLEVVSERKGLSVEPRCRLLRCRLLWVGNLAENTGVTSLVTLLLYGLWGLGRMLADVW